MESIGTVSLERPGVTIGSRHFSQRAVDVALAVALACLGLVEILRYAYPGAMVPGADSEWGRFVIGVSAIFVVISTLSTVFRRAAPMVVLVLTASAVILSPLVNQSAAGWIALMIGCFSAGMQGPRRRNVVIGFVTLAAIDLAWWGTLFGSSAFDPVLPGLVVVAAGFMWAGSALRVRTRQAADFKADTVRLQLEREHEAEQAAAAERSRIARELHDVIAHSLSVIVIQAAAGKRMLDTDPERTRESLDHVEQTGRSAMLEMRRLLGVARHDEPDSAVATSSAPRVPQPSVAELDKVVADMRQAGLDVTLRVEGESRELPVGVDVSAYRIVQEALTNITRHSVGAKAEVVVRYLPHQLEIGVEDDGGDQSATLPAPDSELPTDHEQPTGHGLVGMRERVALLRGEFHAGPRHRVWLRGLRHAANRAVIRLAIVDDQTLVRTGFRMILSSERDIEVVGEHADGAQAVEHVPRERADVVLMDIRMPVMDGLEATRRLAEASPQTRVVILTTYDLDEYIFDGFRAGASGFLLKDAPPEQLVEAIRVAAAGEALLSPSVTRRLVEEFARIPTGAVELRGLDELTARELEVLKLIARGESNSEIAAELVVSEATVKTHVAHVLDKLGCRDRVQAVVLAYESGLIQPGSHPPR